MRYFELRPDVGCDPDGCPQPIASYGVVHSGPPTMVEGEVVDVDQTTTIGVADAIGILRARIIPNTRIVEAADDRLAGVLANPQSPFVEIEPPTADQLAKAEEATRDHREARAKAARPARRATKQATKPVEPETTQTPATPANTQEG